MEQSVFTDEKIEDNVFIREFSADIDNEELLWHKDAKDRMVEVLDGENWALQMDNRRPTPLKKGNKYFIPKETYHRLIKETKVAETINFYFTDPHTYKIINYYNLSGNDVLGAGTNGIVFNYQENKVLKITKHKREVDAVKKIKSKNLPHYVKIYDILKINFNEKIEDEYYVLIVEKLKSLTQDEQDFIYKLNLSCVYDYPKIKKNPKKYKDDFLKEYDSQYQNNLSENQKEKMYFQFLVIYKELRVNNNIADLNGTNCGWRDDEIVFFDSQLFNEVFDLNVKNIMLESNLKVKIFESPATIDKYNENPLYHKILKHFSLTDHNILGAGNHGIAFNYNGDILKITTDKIEWGAAKKIKTLNLRHYVQIKKVFLIKDNESEMYGIVMEKLRRPSPPQQQFLSDLYRYSQFIQKRYGKTPDFYSVLQDNQVNAIFSNSLNGKITFNMFHQYFLAIDELNGIEIYDLHEHNFGFRKDGTLVFFDGRLFDEDNEKDFEKLIFETHDYDSSVLEEYEELPLYNKILKHFQLSKNDILGVGGYGVAFNYQNNKVLKITDDYDEWKAAKKLKAENLKHYVRIDNLFLFKDKDNTELYVIILEKLKHLTKDEQKFITMLNKADFDKTKTFIEFIDNIPKTNFTIELSKIIIIISQNRAEKLYNQYVSAYNELTEQHDIEDLHGGNCGYRENDPNTLVFFDGQIYDFFDDKDDVKKIIFETYNQDTINHYQKIPEYEQILKHFNLTGNEILGAGEYGVAFEYEKDKVLKLTDDAVEFNTAKRIKSLNLKHILSPLKLVAIKIKTNTYYVIIMKKLRKPTEEEINFIHKIRWLPDFQQTDQEYVRNLEWYNVKFDDLYQQYLEVVKIGEKHRLSDFNAGNWGWDGDTMKYFDTYLIDDNETTNVKIQDIIFEGQKKKKKKRKKKARYIYPKLFYNTFANGWYWLGSNNSNTDVLAGDGENGEGGASDGGGMGESIYRYGSKKWIEEISQYKKNITNKKVLTETEQLLLSSDIGEYGEYKKTIVPLDLPLPLEDGKFEVFVRNQKEINRILF